MQSLPPLDHSTLLAVERTRLAQERTVLAWIRTAVSLITFGFAIYSFFAIPSGAGHEHASHLGPRIFSIALIAMGLVSLLLAAIQRRRGSREMKTLDPSKTDISMGAIVGFMVAALGLLALALILLRV
ncbi:MAG TPA: DUF202 domain-containing protein [Candidatus Tumulicola sp.]|jgi:putative membrane protein